MQWKRLLVPFLSVLTFVGCVGYLVLFRAFCKVWRQKPLRSFLVLLMAVTALVHLLLQSTVTYLNFLELWVPQDAISCVTLSFTNTLVRITILPMYMWLVNERYLAIWKPTCHSSLNSIRWGLIIGGSLIFFTAFLSTLLLHFGLVGSDCVQNPQRGDVTRWTIECILAFMTLTLAGSCMPKSRCRCDYEESRTTGRQDITSVIRLGFILSISSISVCLLQLASACRTMELTTKSLNAIETVSSVIDIVGFSLLPISLFMGKAPFGICVIPS